MNYSIKDVNVHLGVLKIDDKSINSLIDELHESRFHENFGNTIDKNDTKKKEKFESFVEKVMELLLSNSVSSIASELGVKEKYIKAVEVVLNKKLQSLSSDVDISALAFKIYHEQEVLSKEYTKDYFNESKEENPIPKYKKIYSEQIAESNRLRLEALKTMAKTRELSNNADTPAQQLAEAIQNVLTDVISSAND